ncbi:CARDB domain-containing protein [Clostridium sp. MB40-C1]|uniref:DUF7507 domain-containing protein n=1 Tax=Clostridium sp. MB40-C1 TaxID=3070996 RepID=UPI0027E1A95C|nr:SdrD B-like domain-containing protein [Clostridium sp. MB40-C1]WMJ80619.1 CARDB domain-containing protein [Clostridium sp. MB40-C1]
MAATITGIVFDDLNHNGVLDPGEPGIPNAYVVIRDPNGVCTTVQTNASGIYTFSNLIVAGNYTVYETAVDPGATCPPTTFGQPAGFTNSSTFRTETINVTQTQIDNNVIINGRDYGHDNPQTFTCIAIGYQVAIPAPGANSQFLEINLVTGNLTVINPDMGIAMNSIGYNVLDNMIYGIEDGSNNLIRVAQDGSITNFGPITGLPAGVVYTTGDIDNQGRMYAYANGSTTFYEIDVNQNSPTFGQVINTVPIASTPIADWSWNPIDGQLYGVTNTGIVVRVDPSTGNVTNLTTVGVPAGAFYGATFIDASGTLYAISNGTGLVYRITISGNNATGEEFSEAVQTTGNDGAACANALLEIDFGDAPDPTPGTGPDDYNTLLANNGPRHQIINQLTLGTQVTGEPDAYANLTTDATGDDIPQGIQDDGVTLPLTPLLVTDTTYSLTVDVVNNTGLPANVYGWIDFNKDGVFQGNEAAPVVVVPSAPGVQQIVLNFTVPVGVTLTPDHTFVRVRLTTDELINQNPSPTDEDTRSIGPASDGEVEDYYLQIDPVADISVVKTVNPDPVVAGNQAIYTITVSNAGPSDATNVILTDVIPACILNPEFSIDGGLTWNPWVSPYNIGTIVAGGTVTVLIRGTVDPSCTGTITNTATVSSDVLDPDPTNNTSTIVTQIDTSADLSITKTVNPDPVVAGEQATYTITVNNAGPSDALNVTLTDVIPACILNPEFSLDGGVTFNPWVSPYVIGTMAAGATVTILIRGTVDPSCTGTITNTARVDSTTPDPDPTNNETTIVTPIDTSADLSIVKTVDPDPVVAGEQAIYTITVNNAGPSDAQNVTLTDAIPACILNPEFSIDGGLTWNPWVNPYVIGTIAAGATVTILIRGTVDPSCTGTITNTARVDSTTPDPDPTNNETTIVTPIDTSADLSIVKTVNPDPVVAGEEAIYTITACNAGPSDAQNVILTDVVPACILNPEYSLDGGITWAAWTGSVNLGTIPAGQCVTVLIRGTVDPSCTGAITNTARVDSTTPDPDPTNNETIIVTPIDTSADLSITKTVNPDPVVAGEEAIYTITACNAGPSDALNVILADAVPACLLNPEYSLDGGVTWAAWTGSVNLGTIPAGQCVTVLIRGTVDPSCMGTITNTARVDSTTPDPDPTNNETTIVTPIDTSADLSITKTVNPDPVVAGEEATYTITACNAGPSDAQSVILTDAVPACLLNPEYSLDGGVTWAAWTGSVNLGTIPAGQCVIILIRGTVDPSCMGTITNTARVDSTTPDPDPTNNETTIVTPIDTLADVSVVKTANADNFTTGDVVTYTIAVTNAGPSDAQNVILTDVVPPQILNPEFSIDGGVTWSPWVSPYNIGTIAVGTTVTILIRGTVSETAIGTVRNIASISSDTQDPDPTNNKSTVDVEVKVAKLEVVKSVDKTAVKVGDTLTYIVTIKNTGNVPANDVVFKDQIPQGTSFVSGSVTINGMPDVGANPEAGFNIGTINPGETILVSFTVKIELRPTPPQVVNVAVVDYNFIVDPTRPPIEKSDTSNEVVTQVEIVQVDVLKSADKTFVIKGDTITYTVIITNSSTIPVNDVVFTDPIPDGTSFVPGSVTINGNLAGGNPSTGINLGTLDSGETVKVSFKVKVDFVPCPPRILNKAFVSFNYVLGDNIIEETVESNSSIIDIGPTSFKQLSREEYVKIPVQKPDIEEILNIVVDIEITNTKVIKTPIITSLEGQNLTGFKLIVEGVLNQKVEYIACDEKQSVHAAHFRVPFSTFIILPESYVEGTNIEIEAIVEDIYSKLVNKRTVFKNITFMILAKF